MLDNGTAIFIREPCRVAVHQDRKEEEEEKEKRGKKRRAIEEDEWRKDLVSSL